MSVPDNEIHNTDIDIVNNVEIATIICRGCLKTNGEMKNMYECGLDEDFFKYTDILRDSSEGMPHLLCEECELALKNTKRFKTTCQQSDKTLRSHLEKRKSDNRSSAPVSDQNQAKIISLLRNMKLLFLITAPNPQDTIHLTCPHKLCSAKFIKKNLLVTHLRKAHNISEDFEVETQYYCTENDCIYNMTSGQNIFFTGRKYLNQHFSKIHSDKMYCCEICCSRFSKVSDLRRHWKTCNIVYNCTGCSKTYNSKEAHMVHLLRKHPELHAKYKQAKKTHKRLSEIIELKNVEIPTKIQKEDIVTHMTKFPPLQLNIDVFESTIPPVDYNVEISPVDIVDTESAVEIKTATVNENNSNNEEALLVEETGELVDEIIIAEDFTIEEESVDNETTTENVSVTENLIGEESLEPVAEECVIVQESSCEEIEGHKKSSATQIPEDITNDVSLTSWSNKNDFEFQNEMSTQTVFEDLLSMKSHHSEDEIFFSESVSLSDIQTQTAPLEFGLSRCNKETQSCTSQTQSPDLSIKETQTCFCHYDSPRHNFRIFDSFSSSPASNNLTSTETQTADFRTLVRSDVLLSFSSAETQTCFDEGSNSSM